MIPTLLFLVGAALGSPSVETALGGALGGGTPADSWTAITRVGYPSTAVTVQRGLTDRWTLLTLADTQLFVRAWLGVGVNRRLLSGSAGTVSGELLVGAEGQADLFPSLGPSSILRLRAAHPGPRFVPYLDVSGRFTVLGQQVVTELATETRSERHFWLRINPAVSGGLGVVITPHWGLEVGLDWMVETAATVSLPGIHLGVGVGW